MSVKVEGKGVGLDRSIAELGERRAEVMEDKTKEDAEHNQMQKESKGKKRRPGQGGSKGHRK